jgi:hypothetical protein
MVNDLNLSARPRKWYEIWWEVYSRPGVTSFQSILNEPDHSATRGFIWIAIPSLIAALASSMISVGSLQNIEPGFASPWVYFLCVVILTPIFAILGVIISTGIYHWIAKLLGGSGSWTDLVFSLSAIIAPSELIAGAISLISFVFLQIPVFIFIPWGLSFVFGIYVIILSILAIMAAEKIGAGKAALAYFIPLIFVGLIALCSLLALIPVFRTTG